MNTKDKETVGAVVVSYNPSVGFIERLDATQKQVDHLVIVDNASDAVSLKMIETYAKRFKHIILFVNDTNIGLAKAQNQGIKACLDAKCEWVLLLDDDSTPAPDMVNELLSFSDGFGIVAAHIQQPDSPHPTRYVAPRGLGTFRRVTFGEGNYTNTIDDVSMVIASGSMISANTLHRIGLMRSDFFIDYIDTEYCLRARKHNIAIRVVKHATLEHHIGEKKAHNILGKKVASSNHSAQRRYTIYRNRVAAWKSYALSNPHYIIYDMLASVFDVLRIIVFEQQKIVKIQNLTKGFLHGIMGKFDYVP